MSGCKSCACMREEERQGEGARMREREGGREGRLRAPNLKILAGILQVGAHKMLDHHVENGAN